MRRRARASSPIPLFDPVYYDDGKQNGRNASLKFVNYLGFFVEEMQGNEVDRPHHPDRRHAQRVPAVRRRRRRSRKSIRLVQ